MTKQENYLALCLLEALEDQNLQVLEDLLVKYRANPNAILLNKDVAPIHLVIGGENLEFSESALKLMLDHGGDPNVTSEGGMTPLHVAANLGNTNMVEMLLKCGANVDLVDEDNKTAILYAIYESHFQVVKLIQNHVFEHKVEKKKQQLRVKCFGGYLSVTPTKNSLSAIQNLEENKYTPNKIHYNFDSTSPYFINITHRRKNDSKSLKDDFNQSLQNVTLSDVESDEEGRHFKVRKNLFELTESNLNEFTRSMRETVRRSTIIDNWREKVADLKKRNKLSTNLGDIEKILSKFSENSEADESFVTAMSKSTKGHEVVTQLMEEYVHTDAEEGMVFYEKKYVNPVNGGNEQTMPASNDLDTSSSTQSTVLTVPPMDYDTDVLRKELTMLGEPPGPITKSTKILYLKKLIKIQRDPRRLAANVNDKQPMYSVELATTFRSEDKFLEFVHDSELEEKMSESFNQIVNKRRREGHIKTSFIYLLIDPRLSDNLPGQQKGMTHHELWKRFLKSIFYVGKGKSSRPYSHLYDAMKLYAQNNDENLKVCLENEENLKIEEKIIFRNVENIAKFTKSTKILNRKQANDSEKLNRIIDIWRSGKGVVCLHVFHNIMPEEAYTREASIIDSIGLQNLTNLKRGDYYGVTTSWPMKSRKHLGISLLYNAMRIFLAEGESQLMPTDLI